MSPPVPKTIVHQLHEMAERLKDAPALWTRRGGTWVATSWRQYARRVRDLSLGLQALGFGPGDCLAIFSFNREEWVESALGAMAAGGVGVGLYLSASPEQLQQIIDHCDASILLVENEARLATLAPVLPRLEKVKQVVLFEAPAQPREGVVSFAELVDRGARADEGDYYARVEALRPEGLAQLIYTSGTTGAPRGVMLSHRNLCWTTAQLSGCHPTSHDDMLLSYLPLSHIAEQVCTIYGPILNGMQVSFAQSFERLADDLREVRPTLFFGVPRVWEKFKARAEEALASQGRVRRRAIAWAQAAAADTHVGQQAHLQPTISQQAKYLAARRAIFRPLKARIGLDRAHVLATSAAPIAREVLDFFASLDLPLLEIYGQSETCGPTSVSTREQVKFGKVGRPMPGVEVRIADDGEVLVRGGNVCLGYYKDEAATAELLRNGWLHSGDLGAFDEDGFLSILGRKKELIVTSGGKKTAPAFIEGLLKQLEPLGNALVSGDGRNHLVALLALDPQKASHFAAARGLPVEPGALAQAPAFRAWLDEAVGGINARLSRFETIKAFHVLPHDFTIEGGELTPTLKVRRQVVEAKYRAQLDALYA